MRAVVAKSSIMYLLLLTLAACSAMTFSQSASTAANYQAKSGAYTVAVADNLVVTTKSGRKMPVKVYYPEARQRFPVIIFSHGGGGSKNYYRPLGQFWASHGYVSIHPTHYDSIEIRGRQFKRELAKYSLENPEAWEDRATDISAIIDSLTDLTRQAPALQRKLDTDRIGVGGHSFGAYTAQLVGGAKIDIPKGPKGKSFTDRRAKALLLLSPQGKGQQGLTATSWNTMTLPMMFMTGTDDKLFDGKGPEWRREGFDSVPTGDKYLIFLEGANHFSFSGRLANGDNSTPKRGATANTDGRSKGRIREWFMQRRLDKDKQAKKSAGGAHSDVDQAAIFEYVQIGSLAFWDAYLKSEADAKTYLTDKSLEKLSDGVATVSIR